MDVKSIISAARERLNVEALMPMQSRMADLKADVSSVVLLAPTGSGKTLAFALAMLRRVSPQGRLQAVVVAPSRELVMQITKVTSALARELRVTAVYGGHPMTDETRSLQGAPPDVVVGTPGRLLDHVHRRSLDVRRVATLVLDEYDKSLELGFQGEMSRLIAAMRAVKFTVLTSATMPRELPEFMRLTAPLTLDYTDNAAAVPQLSLHAVASPVNDKLDTLAELLNSLPRERAIVFVNHRESVERVYQHLVKAKFPAVQYHGALEQQDRETAVDLFTNGTSPILVATDLAARGLDIPRVQSVIHYHLPPSPEAGTHRNGRAGRMGAPGDVYYIISPSETAPDGVDEYLPQPQSQPWRRTMLTLYFHAGRKEKLSKGDVAGALMAGAGLPKEAVGVITAHDHRVLAAVDAQRAADAMAALQTMRIKGKRVKVSLVK
jgi:superfamily II DNA/RNA helicase